MAKKEFKIGEVFCFGSNINLRVEKNIKGCIGCYFSSKECHYNCMDKEVDKEVDKETGSCLKDERSDKTSIIFVKVEE